MNTALDIFKKNSAEILYLLVFLIPLAVSPWGGVNHYEVFKQGFFVAFLGAVALILAISLVRRRRMRIPFHPAVFIVLGLWVLSYVISQIFSIAPLQSFWGTYQRLQGTFIHIYYGIHLLLCLWIFGEEKIRKLFLHLIFWVGVTVSGYGIYQFLEGLLPKNAAGEISMPTIFGDRIFSTMGNPNFLGQFLIFPIFIALSFGFEKLRNKRWLPASLYIFTLAIMASALWLTHNRASMLGIAVGGIIWLALNLPKYKKWIFTASGIGIVVMALIILPRLDTRSMSSRVILWQTSLRAAVSTQVFFGSGLETITERLMPILPKEIYVYESMNHMPDRAHNEALDILLTRGIFGLILYLIPIGFLIWSIWKNRISSLAARVAASSILAYLVSMVFGFSVTPHVIILLGFWALLLNETLTIRKLKLKVNWAISLIIFMALISFAFLSMRNSYDRVRADVDFSKGISAFLYENPEALNVFENAISFAPNYRYWYESLFIFYENLTEAEKVSIDRFSKFAERTQNISPTLFYGKFLAAQVEFWKGDYAEGEMLFANALERAPAWARGWYVWGIMEFNAGRLAEAVKPFKALRDLAPPYETWDAERRRIFQISNYFYFDGMQKLSEAKMKNNIVE